MIKKLLLAFALAFAFTFSSPGIVDASAASTQTAAPTASIYDRIKQNTQGVKPNTSAMLDKISMLASSDAKSVNDAAVNAALNWLDKHRDNLFASNEVMETVIYYGTYLDKAFPDNDARSRIGWQAVKAVKYVYRGAESPSDSSPQKAMKKMGRDLDMYLLTHP